MENSIDAFVEASFDSLDKVALLKILSFMNPIDVLKICTLNEAKAKFCANDAIWRDLIAIHFKGVQIAKGISARETYKYLAEGLEGIKNFAYNAKYRLYTVHNGTRIFLIVVNFNSAKVFRRYDDHVRPDEIYDNRNQDFLYDFTWLVAEFNNVKKVYGDDFRSSVVLELANSKCIYIGDLDIVEFNIPKDEILDKLNGLEIDTYDADLDTDWHPVTLRGIDKFYLFADQKVGYVPIPEEFYNSDDNEEDEKLYDDFFNDYASYLESPDFTPVKSKVLYEVSL